MTSVESKNQVSIRLTDERWTHIVEGHPELQAKRAEVLSTVQDPVRIVEGDYGDLLAARQLETGTWLIVVYKEVSSTDGFVITAYVAKTSEGLDRRLQIWP